MPLKTIAKFEVQYLQVLDEKGKVDSKLMPKVPDKTVLKWYRDMVLARKFSDKMLSLQRQGRMGTFAPVDGQEACQVGSCAALQPDDWMVPAFREIACYVHRGENLVPMLLYNMGSEQGNVGEKGFNNFTAAVPVASQYVHGVGLAWASKIKGEKKVSIVYGGDGASSEGDFYEALNFAGVFQVPCVIVTQNNHWAISLPRAKQTKAETLAQKGIAAGIPSMQVDGNDIFAVYKATKEAVDRARKGEGPTYLEFVTYRLSMHTTADDPKVYRSEKEVEAWKKKDPIERLRKYMEKKKLWSSAKEKQLQTELDEHISKAVKDAEAKLNKDPKEMFKYVLKEMPEYLKEEMAEFGGEADD
ncbi:MAG: pyruvate dehydrogenase (acetyl-transferring) E1 component subunit alpha [Candidatus Nanoarchaeia archaeon]